MIRTDGPWFKDEHGRTLILRGVNLGGSSKVPYCPDGATYIRQGFYDHRNVSFVGRPFPLEEADEHLARLRSWGLTFLRLLVPWEAVEHGGPGVYDLEYLDYLREVVRRAGEHGLHLFIDPHQDVWSRMSGGDGAPGWTFEAVGMDVTRLPETGAAIVHAIHGDPFPRMIWPSNYTKLAAATMFTLFFGGNDFAPRTLVDGEPVQEYLQRHYINAMVQVAQRLKGLPAVVGYDTLNEPSSGYIGWADLNSAGPLLLGESPTAVPVHVAGSRVSTGYWCVGATPHRAKAAGTAANQSAGSADLARRARLHLEGTRRVGCRRGRTAAVAASRLFRAGTRAASGFQRLSATVPQALCARDTLRGTRRDHLPGGCRRARAIPGGALKMRPMS